MARAVGGAILGGLLGLVCGFLISSGGWAEVNTTYLRNCLCAVLGAGFGAVSGAILGGTDAIVHAIRQTRPPF